MIRNMPNGSGTAVTAPKCIVSVERLEIICHFCHYKASAPICLLFSFYMKIVEKGRKIGSHLIEKANGRGAIANKNAAA